MKNKRARELLRNYTSEKGNLENGAEIGTLGSMTYLLGKDGTPISYGFHEINPLPPDDSEGQYYMASLGSRDFLLDSRGRIVYGVYGRTPSEYAAEIAGNLAEREAEDISEKIRRRAYKKAYQRIFEAVATEVLDDTGMRYADRLEDAMRKMKRDRF